MTTTVEYIGDFKCKTTHIKSNTHVITDAPTDNKGKGESFSPTDLFASSLGQCCLTTIAILGNDRNINIDGATCDVSKIMSEKPPRMVAEIICEFHFPQPLNEKEQKFIRLAVDNCPVGLSLHPDVKKNFIFNFIEN